ncbi:hypothetical protein YC2023_031921 [Brassica napus]
MEIFLCQRRTRKEVIYYTDSLSISPFLFISHFQKKKKKSQLQIKNPRKQLCIVIIENERSTAPPCTIPERIFKAGKEPTGVRVTPYHKPFGIKQILNALEPEEIEKIRASPFGKFVELADKPSFSGRFGRYIISRQLKVSCYSIELKYLKPHIINSLHGIPNRSTHHLNRLPSPFYYISGEVDDIINRNRTTSGLDFDCFQSDSGIGRHAQDL